MSGLKMQLSENFTLDEFEKSMTARRLGIDNHVPYELISKIIYLTQTALQSLRDYRAQPIIIGSGYRCLALNSYIGSEVSSQHPKGEAADIDDLEDNLILFDLIIKMKIPFDQLIWEYGEDEPEWIHMSCKKKGNRQQVLKAYRDNHGVHHAPFVYKVIT